MAPASVTPCTRASQCAMLFQQPAQFIMNCMSLMSTHESCYARLPFFQESSYLRMACGKHIDESMRGAHSQAFSGHI